jgi:hypothetical protein
VTVFDLEDNSLDFPALDALFVLDPPFSVINVGDGHGKYQARSSEGELVMGWTVPDEPRPLFDSLAWLSAVTPRTLRPTPVILPYILPIEDTQPPA